MTDFFFWALISYIIFGFCVSYGLPVVNRFDDWWMYNE